MQAANLKRRIVLNTSISLRALVTFLLSVSWTAGAWAAGHHVVHLAVMTEGVAQATKSKAERQELDGLMAKARKAIKEGDFETAETLIAQAEAKNFEFSVFHLGDTPKKLRADLTAKRKGKKSAPERPSEKFKPEVPEAQPAPTEPLRPAAPSLPAKPASAEPDPLDEAPLQLPTSEGKLTQATPSQRPPRSPDDEPVLPVGSAAAPRELPRTSPDNSQSRRESDGHLLAARRALAVGDVRRATTEVESARKLNVQYGQHDDTPDRVEAGITRYRQVTEAAKGRQDEASRRQLAETLMDQAQHLIRWRDYDEAERLVNHVKGLRINFGAFESKPEALLERIAAGRAGGASQPPARLSPAATQGLQKLPKVAAAQGGAPNQSYPTAPAVYDPRRDATRNRATAAQEPAEIAEPGELEPAEPLPTPQGRPRRIPEELSSGMQLFEQGEQALKDHDMQKALELFRQAYNLRDQLDAGTSQRLQDHLQLLSAPTPGRMNRPETLLDSAASKDQLVAKQLAADIAQKEIAAGKVREKDPKKAMELLKEARAMVETAQIEPSTRATLLRRVDRRVADLDRYIADNRAQIELDEANKEVLKEVDRRLKGKVEVDEKLAKLVDEYNRLMDEQRYAEAEVMAKRARELDPDNPLVKQLLWNSRFVSRNRRNQDMLDDKENAHWETLNDVENAIVPNVGDDSPIKYIDAKSWADLTKTRSKQMAEKRSRRTERELEIERKLSTPVSCKFRQRPLADVIDELRKLTGVNIHLDQKGLDEEGVSSDTPITIDLTSDISLKSALKLILEPLHLSYVIKDEVLKITSEQLRDGEVYFVTYNVADLVIPIPNFVPNGRMGLAGALGEAYNMAGGSMGGVGGSNMAYLASADGTPATGVVNPNVMAQINQMMPGARPAGSSPVTAGPGGAGGGAAADFDSLIELITTTVKPQTWDEVGGPGTVSEFRNNLSLVISQTQDVHEEIVDLLEQLRRNQDLQVTIEVRFITLNDNFFERIGVDFQFNITNQGPNDPTQQFPTNKKEIWGLEPPATGAGFPNFTADSDIPFRQSSFNLATPQFGQPVEVARFGFAILSDLEAFLLVSAAQGDRRSNVLQAPKVTLFNGQQASVFDQTTTPFVISVIPVVGDFAAAYQPVITVLSEGTSLTVQATISNDRRFVRLTVLPFFSQIGDVSEFTFSGSKRVVERASASSSKTPTPSGDSTSSDTSGDLETSSDGITVQLPNFSFVTVNTTVSVPDGGTVLLGGIKRLSEGRNEFGVPILSKLPYINRLFKNVGIGRETQSLMMMVTPRIIIQEEEEERLGIQTPP